MSLIENLEPDDWRSYLKACFRHTLKLLATDRFRWAGSATDDLQSWLTAGGIHRVKLHLNRQMEMRQFPLERKVAVNDTLNKLAKENRQQLLSLMAKGVIPFKKKELLTVCAISENEFEKMINLMIAGSNPFEDWMRANNRSEEEITAIYKAIDNCIYGQ